MAGLWRWRGGVAFAILAQRGGAFSEDIAVPLDRLRDVARETHLIGARHDVPALSFGHAGDGNIHATFLFSPDREGEEQRADDACHELFDLAHSPRRVGLRRARHRLVEARTASTPARPGRLRPAHAAEAGVRPERLAQPRQEALSSLGALRERQFRLLFTGQIVSLLGDALTGVALAFAVLDLTGSATDLGIVFAAKTVPLVAFLLVGGVFADRLPRRVVMLVADVVRFVAQGAVALLVLTHSAHVWELVVLQAISGTATAFFNPASTGLTPLTVSPERLQQANALRGTAMALSGIVGSALSGVLVVTIGPGWALAIDSITFAVSAFFLAQLRLPPQVTLPPQTFLRDLRDGWHEFASRTWVWAIVVGAAVGNMMVSIFVVLGAVISKESLGGPGAWALIVTALGIGSLLGSIVALRLHVRRPLFLGSALVGLFALPIALLALHAPVVVIAGAALLGGAGNLIFNALWETTLQQHIPQAALSRVSAYDWFGSLAFQPLGLVIAGPAAAAIGSSTTLWIAAGVFLVQTLAILAIPSVRRLEARPT